jgi:hypothetical protein
MASYRRGVAFGLGKGRNMGSAASTASTRSTTSTRAARAHLSFRRAGAGAPAADAADARPRRRASTRPDSSRAIAARRSAASTSSCGRRRSTSPPRTSSSSRASTRISARRWSGARSRPTCSPARRYDGVFAMWYGKGPGVDRCGDVFKHGNAAGTSKLGGVLALAADDHACRSSTLPHGSELEFVSAMMPILNPAGVQDILDMGLLGWAMSRFTGRWVGFKTIAETVESSSQRQRQSAPARHRAARTDFMPDGGLNIRWPDPPLNQEMRLHQYAVQAATAFARANRIDRIVHRFAEGAARHRHHRQELSRRAAGARIPRHQTTPMARDIGIRVYKIGMTWPLEPVGIREFARGLEDIIVVEEKRSFIESQMKEYMYNWPTPPERGRQVRRGRQLDPAEHQRTDAGDDRAGHRASAWRASSPARRSVRASRGSRPRNRS